MKSRFFIISFVVTLALGACGKEPQKEEPVLTVDKTTLTFGITGGEQVISLTSNGEWMINTVGGWFTVHPSSGSGSASVTVSAPDNSESNKRDGILQFVMKDPSYNASVTIHQDGSPENMLLPDTILKETFASSRGSFTIEDKSKPSALDYIWTSDSGYKCMKASGYKDGTDYDTESWLISPEIDLTERVNANLSFDHAGNFFDTAKIKEQNMLKVTADNGATWEDVAIPVHHKGNSWSFISSGNIDLGSKYKGKKIKIAFVYKSSSAKAGTWEVKNVLISRTSTGDVGNTYKGVPGWMELPKVTDEKTFHIHAAMDGTKKVRNYSMNYDEENLVATWTAYPLCDWYTNNNVSRDDFDWMPNPFVERQAVIAKAGDWYNPNGYERGHQIASADRRVNASLQQQTFYYTNAAPMHKGDGFNAGIWGNLENKVRGWSEAKVGTDTLYVVTGAIVKEGGKTVKDNDGKLCTVPEAYFKALLRYDKDGKTNGGYMAAGYYIEHKPYSSWELNKYAMSIDELEKKTGLTFFVNLEAAVGKDTAAKITAEKPADNAFWK